MRMKALIGGLTFSVAALAAGLADAAVTQITLRMGGQVCTVPDNSQAGGPDLTTSMVNEFGWVNGGGATATVICPVPQYMSGTLSRVNLMVYDRNRFTNLSCSLFRLANGGKVFVGSNTNPINNSSAEQTLSISAPGAGAGQTLSLICSVPGIDPNGGSGVFSGIQAVDAIYSVQ